jgi:hypothetical protein
VLGNTNITQVRTYGTITGPAVYATTFSGPNAVITTITGNSIFARTITGSADAFFNTVELVGEVITM